MFGELSRHLQEKKNTSTWAGTTNLSKNILTAKMSKAIGKAVNKCAAFGYSTPGAGSARSAQVTLCGNQNLSFQNQAERAAMFDGVPLSTLSPLCPPGREKKKRLFLSLEETMKLVGRFSRLCLCRFYRATLNFTSSAVKSARSQTGHPGWVFKIRSANN